MHRNRNQNTKLLEKQISLLSMIVMLHTTEMLKQSSDRSDLIYAGIANEVSSKKTIFGRKYFNKVKKS